MIAQTQGFVLDGITATPVTVEVDIHRGLPHFQILGMPDTAVRECRERVRAALVNGGYEFPLQRITVNVMPASPRRTGPALDLAIAVGVLKAAGELTSEALNHFCYAAELALDGSLRPVRGALAMAEAARDRTGKGIVLNPANAREAALAKGANPRSITNISELRKFEAGGHSGKVPMACPPENADLPDLADLRGQNKLRQALEVAAAGGHNLLMVGPPGSGKSLAARRLPSLLPPMDENEILEVARIQGCCGLGDGRPSNRRPFRAPHHTVSTVGLIGGGTPTRPGEITLAHRGVLFLDEIVEFSRASLEALRSPLHHRNVTIARAAAWKSFPADFQLIAATSPCPCGRGETDPACRCPEASLRRYRAAIDTALASQIDIRVEVEVPSAIELAGDPGEPSATVQSRVIAARERMTHRYASGKPNAAASRIEASEFEMTDNARLALADKTLVAGSDGAGLLRLARTLADLDDNPKVTDEHIEGAFGHTRTGQILAG